MDFQSKFDSRPNPSPGGDVDGSMVDALGSDFACFRGGVCQAAAVEDNGSYEFELFPVIFDSYASEAVQRGAQVWLQKTDAKRYNPEVKESHEDWPSDSRWS